MRGYLADNPPVALQALMVAWARTTVLVLLFVKYVSDKYAGEPAAWRK